MKSKKSVSSGALCALALLMSTVLPGCSGEGADMNNSENGSEASAEALADEQVASDATDRVLAEVEVEEGSVATFVAEEEGDQLIGLTVMQRFPADVVAPLANPTPEDATLLELFSAVSSDAPPVELVEAHQEDAVRSGRDPEFIRSVSFDRTVLKGSYDPNLCTERILQYTNDAVIRNDMTYPDWTEWAVKNASFILSNDGTLADRYNVGICADSGSAQAKHTYLYRYGGSGAWSTYTSGTCAISQGFRCTWTTGPFVGQERRARIRSKGDDYHLRVGWGTIYSP